MRLCNLTVFEAFGHQGCHSVSPKGLCTQVKSTAGPTVVADTENNVSVHKGACFQLQITKLQNPLR